MYTSEKLHCKCSGVATNLQFRMAFGAPRGVSVPSFRTLRCPMRGPHLSPLVPLSACHLWLADRLGSPSKFRSSVGCVTRRSGIVEHGAHWCREWWANPPMFLEGVHVRETPKNKHGGSGLAERCIGQVIGIIRTLRSHVLTRWLVKHGSWTLQRSHRCLSGTTPQIPPPPPKGTDCRGLVLGFGERCLALNKKKNC